MATKKKTPACRCLTVADRALKKSGYRVQDLLRLKGTPRRALIVVTPLADVKKPKPLHFAASYCPFCGQKYPE